MDHHSHRPQVQTHEQDGGGSGNSSKRGGGSGNSNFLCKQNNSRWTPTTDQIRILKELYYNNGVRSPSADQIQRITARLRQYGKIEGKNVFYWFQNHKARERQKKRLTNTTPSSTTSDLHPHHHYHMSMSPMQRSSISFNGVSSSPSSSAGVIGVGQMGSFGSYGSVTMEKSFRECSISSAAGGSNINWFGMDPYYSSSYNNTGLVFDRTPTPSVKESFDFYGQYHHGDGERDHEDDGDGRSASPPGVETLPLFPMHGEGGIIDGFHRIEPESDGGHGYYAATSGRTSLELSLCSFTGQFPDS